MIKFNDRFIRELQSRYADPHNNKSQILDNARYYTKELIIGNTKYYSCVPLHSHCRGKYIPIVVPGKQLKWKNHGLDLQKMILVTKEDIENNSVQIDYKNVINAKTYKDIMNKKEILSIEINNYIDKWIRVKKSYSPRNYNFIRYSSLNHFPLEVDLIAKQKAFLAKKITNKEKN